MNPTRCFAFSMEDLAQLKELVAEFRKSFIAPEDYPTILGVPFRVTVKSKTVYDGNIVNPDCVLSFTPFIDGVYDIHYETANMMLMDIEGMQRPFDFTIKMNRHDKSGKRYDIIKKPSPLDMQFLKSNYKFGVKNSNADVFLLACQTAEFLYAVFPFLMWDKTIGNNIYYQLVPDFLEIGKKVIKAKAYEQRKRTLTDGWDIVTLTEKQYLKVMDTNVEQNHNYTIDTIALPRFCLSLVNKEETNYYFFEQKGKTIRCGVADKNTFEIGWFELIVHGLNGDNIDVSCRVNEEDPIAKWCNENPSEEDSPNWAWCGNAFFAINTFMLYYADVTMEVETKVATAPSQSHGQKKNTTNVSRLFKTYKLVKNWKSQARKKAQITCPCWGVRGHFRHYRNGKVVFIEPFVKGKEKDKYRGKEYALLPYKDA